MLTKTMIIETAGFMEPSDIPEITGYDEAVNCEIRHHCDSDIERSTTIMFDGKLYLPSQFEEILKQVKLYKLAASHFVED